MNLSGVSTYGQYFHVDGYQIKQPRQSEAGVIIQMEGHTLTPLNSHNSPEEMGV